MKAVDLFAGCGGMSPGFQNAGFEIVGAYCKVEEIRYLQDRCQYGALVHRAGFKHCDLLAWRQAVKGAIAKGRNVYRRRHETGLKKACSMKPLFYPFLDTKGGFLV